MDSSACGRPEQVLARVQRVEEHGDYLEAIAEASERQRHHDSIDRLLSKMGRRLEEYCRLWDEYKRRRSERSNQIALQKLEQATGTLKKLLAVRGVTRAFQGRPPDQ